MFPLYISIYRGLQLGFASVGLLKRVGRGQAGPKLRLGSGRKAVCSVHPPGELHDPDSRWDTFSMEHIPAPSSRWQWEHGGEGWGFTKSWVKI